MNQLRAALQLYRADQGAYPPALLGYVTLYTSGPNAGNVMPANEIKSFLYPRRVGAMATFQPKISHESLYDTTTAEYPNADARAVGSGAVLDLNGDGVLDDPAGARQAYGPGSNVCRNGYVMSSPLCDTEAYFYRVSGYDVAMVQVPGGPPRMERRYALNWTYWGVGVDLETSPGSLGSAMDDPRQLGYLDPPENTVVTWNSFYREYDENKAPVTGRHDIVLFVGGSAKAYDSRAISERSWRILP
jgi:hypothetical protein